MRQNLASFLAEMDRLGEPYGYSGGAHGEPTEVLGDYFHECARSRRRARVLILDGAARVSGADGVVQLAHAGQGVRWAASEPWTFAIESVPLRFFQVSGPLVRVEHFVSAA